MSLGWTFDQIGEEFDIPRIEAMNKYWKKYPPIHVMVAHYLEIKEPEVSEKLSEEEERQNVGLEAALQAFQMGAG